MSQIILTDDTTVQGKNVLHFSCYMLEKVYEFLKDAHLQDIERGLTLRAPADGDGRLTCSQCGCLNDLDAAKCWACGNPVTPSDR